MAYTTLPTALIADEGRSDPQEESHAALAPLAVRLPAFDFLDDARIQDELLAGYRVADFERPAPKAFFDEIVYRESRKMLFRVGDPAKVSPFVGLEHEGTWLTAAELRYLLQAMVDVGLTRFTHYVLKTIKDDVWQVLTEFTAE